MRSVTSAVKAPRPGPAAGPRPWLRRLAGDQSGAAMMEFTIIFSLLMLLTFGIFELALIMGHMTAAEGATRRGARMAVESDPVAPVIASFNGVSDGGLAPGESLSGTAPFTVRCDSTACVCHAGDCSWIGTLGYDAGAFNAILAEMQTMLPNLEADGVLIDYSHVGMGFAGRPGPDIVPMVAVQLRDQSHPFVVLGALGVADWTFPAFPAILPAEDLRSTAP